MVKSKSSSKSKSKSSQTILSIDFDDDFDFDFDKILLHLSRIVIIQMGCVFMNVLLNLLFDKDNIIGSEGLV